MVAGDVVVGFGLLATTTFFQPAVGVEVVITTYWNNAPCRLYNGVNYSHQLSPSAVGGGNQVFVTNSIYFRLDPVAAEYNAYSGVQTK